MKTHQHYMNRCLRLAEYGLGNVNPNPLVGCVIVRKNEIIGEGVHQYWGGPHAEVNAIASVKNKHHLADATLYVNLEPCSHYGKTPPCTDLILQYKIPEVVVGMTDPFEEVAGRGIERLKHHGVTVILDVLKQDCRELNRRFITFHQQKRPYIILKWAQTLDNLIDLPRKAGEKPHVNWITQPNLKMLVHRWRTQEDAVMVGMKTALYDNPQLTVREWAGRNPLRLVIDEHLELPEHLALFDKTVPTAVLTAKDKKNEKNLEYLTLDFSVNILPQIMNVFYKKGVLSILVEGGNELLDSFINSSLWDEARIFTGNKVFVKGLPAPNIHGMLVKSEMFADDRLVVLRNPKSIRIS